MRTGREKQDELLGMIRRDFAPRERLVDGSDCGHNDCPVMREEIEEYFDDGTKEVWENYLNRE